MIEHKMTFITEEGEATFIVEDGDPPEVPTLEETPVIYGVLVPIEQAEPQGEEPLDMTTNVTCIGDKAE